MAKPKRSGAIRVGIGGWTYAPWRDNFYPKGLPHARELAHAGERLTAIEINGTFYRSQGPKSFAKWREETPDDFVFSVKGHRAVVNAKQLGGAGEAIHWFLKSGITELGPKLGPLLWQFAPFKKFDAADLAAFLRLLPEEAGGLPLRHALEIRHASFLVPEFVDLARQHNAAIVFADSDDYPAVADATADFAYARLQRCAADIATGYADEALDGWAARARVWAEGGVPADLPRIEPKLPKKAAPRPVYVFFIAGAKERAPAAAEAPIQRLRG